MSASTLLRRIALLAGVTIAILLVMVIGLRIAAGNAPGRWLIHSQLDGREIAGLGRLELSGLTGDPLASLHIDTLTLSDDEGVWLTARDITLDWQARSVVARPIRINALIIDAIQIDRRPILTSTEAPSQAPPSSSSLPRLPAIDLGSARLERLILAEGVAGPAAELTASLEARLRPQTSRARLAVDRLDAPGDRLLADLTLSADRVYGELTATGDADGTLAALLRMPGRAVRIDGALDGDITAGSGQLSLTADATRWASADLSWSAQSWQADGSVALANWGLLPEPLASEVAEVAIAARGSRGENAGLDEVRLETRGSQVTLHAPGNADIDASYALSPALIERLSGGRLSVGRLSGRGTLHRGESLSLHLAPELERIVAGEVTVGSATGNITLTLPNGRPQAALDVTLTGLSTGQANLDRIAGDTLNLSGTISDAGPEDGWQLAPGFTVATPTLSVSADGRLPRDTVWPVGTASLRIDDVSLLAPSLSGPASADLRIDEARHMTVSVDGGAVSWPEAMSGLLDGLRAEASLTPQGEGWAVDRLHATAPALDLDLSGEVRDVRDWQIGGDLALSGALPVSAVELEGGLATAFRIVRDPVAMRVRAVTTTRQLQLGPLALEAPRLGVRGRLGEAGAATELEWVFTADHGPDDQLALDGRLSLGPDRTELTLARGQLGDALLDGSARLEGGDLDVTLNAVRTDLMTLAARFSGPAEAPMAGTVEASLTLEAQRLGAADLNSGELTLAGPLSAMTLTARAEGRMRSNVDLSATGTVAVTDTGVAVSLSPSGKWAAHNWTTVEPIRFATEPDGISASAAFTLGGGRLDLDVRTAGVSPVAHMTIDSLPVGVLADITAMPATQGIVSGTADLREQDGIWRGTARLDATGLLAGDLPDMPELDIILTAALQDEAEASLRVTGGGLDLRGAINRAGPTTDIARPQGAPDTPIRGQINAGGELLALAALILPSDVLLEGGRIDSDLAISGTVGAPRLNGTATLREGRLNATTAGSLITDIELDLALTERSAEITRLSASDNREGRLSGRLRVDLPEEGQPHGSGRLDYQRFVAVRRPELTLQASGSVDLTLDDSGLLVAGESRIDQLRTQPTLNGAASIPQLQVIEINLPKDRRATTEARIPIRLDYRVRADNGLFVSSRAFSSEWGVDLHVTGPESKPSLTGTASLVGGTAFVFNRRFTLADGTVTFDGAPGDARVDLSAVHSRTGFRATARVEGSVQAPTITLSSDPALPEDEILARLLFDQSVNELGAFEAAQLAAQLSGQSLLDIVGQLRDLAGIDRLDISTNEAGELSVVGGRRFGDNVYVEVGSTGAATINEALIEWSLTPDLSVLSRVSADTDASVAIRWRRDY